MVDELGSSHLTANAQIMSGNVRPPLELWVDADVIEVASETAVGTGALTATGSVVHKSSGVTYLAAATNAGRGGLFVIGSLIAHGGASMHGGS